MINIAELLKDCPRGMELDCTVYDNCTLETVFEGCLYPIQIRTPEGLMSLTKYGSMSQCTHSKCVIFPKGKTTWEGFQMPFKNGDIVATSTGNWIGITAGGEKNCFIPTYCIINDDGKFEAYFDIKGEWEFSRLATEEEKAKLFQAIKDNGYKWNAETKTLEIVNPIEITSVIPKMYNTFKDGSFQHVEIIDEDYELALDKFDITTLKPFESRVLVRNDNCDEWEAGIFGRYSNGYITLGGIKWKQCIPFEGNEHLLGTTDDCDEFFKF